MRPRYDRKKFDVLHCRLPAITLDSFRNFADSRGLTRVLVLDNALTTYIAAHQSRKVKVKNVA